LDRRRWAIGGAVVAILFVGITVRSCRPRGRSSDWFGGSWLPRSWFGTVDHDHRPADDIPDAETVAWCAEGLVPVAGGGCFAAPAAGADPWPLVIYLHGIFDPAAASEEMSRQQRVAAIATAKGFAVLALRGHVGECSAPEYASRICWPSNERNEDGGPGFVAEWKTPLALAAARGGRGRRYVLGFSNGGYFAGLLAERGWFEANAFVVARGGPVQPVKASGRKAPMLLTLSEDDPSHDEMLKLDEGLTRDEWPHEKFVAHGGHALPDADIESAVAFFGQQELLTK